MTKSEQIDLLAAALSAAQAEINDAVKDASNPFFKSHYADLASVREAIRAPFGRHGLAVIQTPSNTEDGRVVVETMLVHKSGQFISERFSGRPAKDDPQALGSVVTYLRRYALQSMAGIAATDDDGEAAMGRTAQQPIAQAKPAAAKPDPKEAPATAAKPAPQSKPAPGEIHATVAKLKTGEVCTISQPVESITPPPAGKKMHRVKFINDPTAYVTHHHLTEVRPGDTITAVIAARENDGKKFYELTEYTPF